MTDSIGSFAEELLANEFKQIREGKTLPPNMEGLPPSEPVEENQRDIREVSVPDSFVKRVLGESSDVEETEKIPGYNPEVATDVPFYDRTPEQMMAELQQILIDARTVLKEMTTVGMIGVRMGKGKKKKKKKRTYEEKGEKNNAYAICTAQKKKSSMDHDKWKRCIKHVIAGKR